MNKTSLCLYLASALAFFSCSKKSTATDVTVLNASGTVRAVCQGCTPSGAQYIPYIIVFDNQSDSILVTNLPANFGVSDRLKITYKDNDTLPMAFTTDRTYPKRATILSAAKN